MRKKNVAQALTTVGKVLNDPLYDVVKEMQPVVSVVCSVLDVFSEPAEISTIYYYAHWNNTVKTLLRYEVYSGNKFSYYNHQ